MGLVLSQNGILYAQVDTTDIDFDNDSLALNYDYTTWDEVWPEGFDTVVYEGIINNAVVNYETKSHAEILMSWSKEEAYTVYIEDTEGTLYFNTTITSPFQSIQLDDLPRDKEFILFIESNGEFYSGGGFETYAGMGESIELPSHMFMPLSEYFSAYEEGDPDIFTFVNNQEWTTTEKSSFLQDYFFRGKPFSDETEGIPPYEPPPLDPDDPPTDGDGGCNCEVLSLSIGSTVGPRKGAPHTVAGQAGRWNNHYAQLPNTKNFSRAGKMWHNYGMQGPAKYMQAWMESPRCTGGNTFKNNLIFSTGGSEGSVDNDENALSEGTNYAEKRFVFACAGLDDGIPRECDCNAPPTVNICWRYASVLNTFTDLQGAFCLAERRAGAFAEDMVFFTSDLEVGSGSTNSMIIEDAELIQAASGCSYDFDEGLLLGNLLSTSLTTLKAFKDPKTVVDQIASIIAGEQLSDKIKALFTDEYVKTDGVCGNETSGDFNIMNDCRRYGLQINREAAFRLTTNQSVGLIGRGRMRADARILSAFGLSSVIERSSPEIAGDICCRNGHASYSLSSFMSSPDDEVLRGWVRNNFEVRRVDLFDDPSNVHDHWGFLNGGQNPLCTLEISSILPLTMSPDAGKDELQKEYLRLSGTDLIVQPKSSTPWRLKIVDTVGRVVKSEEYSGSLSGAERIDFDLPAGIYFIVFQQGEAYQTLKVFNRN